jgi:hypothetical protein
MVFRRTVGFWIAVGLSLCISCTEGIDGEDTIQAGKAAGMLKNAAIARFFTCHPQTRDSSWMDSLGMTRVGCIGAANDDTLLRRSDVVACRDLLLVMPCAENGFSTGMLLNSAALACAAETVPFLFNRVSPPTQGTIISVGSGNNSGGVFYFNCI